MSDQPHQEQAPIDQAHPNIARWVQDFGYIEVGYCPPLRSFIRALDEGGLIWEGAPTYLTLDDAFHALESALATWLHEQGLAR